MILRYKNGNFSEAYHLLRDVERESERGGFDAGWNRPLYQRLERLRMYQQIEVLPCGPRKGKRYYITYRGRLDLTATDADDLDAIMGRL